MDRGADSIWIAEIMKASNVPVLLVETHFDDGVIYLTNAWRSIVWGGNTYTANGHFLAVQGLSETFDMTIPNVTISLSGVDQSWIAVLLTKQAIDRQIIIYKAFVNYATSALVGAPVVLFDGRIDFLSLTDSPADGKSEITVSASNQFVDFNRSPGRHTNPNEQRIFYPSDKGFDMVTNVNPGTKWG